MTRKDTPKDLMAELHQLKLVLNDHAKSLIPDNSMIPVLNDLFEESAPSDKTEGNSKVSSSSPNSLSETPKALADNRVNNLDLATPAQNKKPKDKEDNKASTASLSQTSPDSKQEASPLKALIDRERMIDELVEEILPVVANRLRVRIRKLIEENKL